MRMREHVVCLSSLWGRFSERKGWISHRADWCQGCCGHPQETDQNPQTICPLAPFQPTSASDLHTALWSVQQSYKNLFYRGNHLGIVLAPNPHSVKEEPVSCLCFFLCSSAFNMFLLKSFIWGIILCSIVWFCSSRCLSYLETCEFHGMRVLETAWHLGWWLLPWACLVWQFSSQLRKSRVPIKQLYFFFFCLIPLHVFTALLISVSGWKLDIRTALQSYT